MTEPLNKPWSILTMEYYSPIKKEQIIHAHNKWCCKMLLTLWSIYVTPLKCQNYGNGEWKNDTSVKEGSGCGYKRTNEGPLWWWMCSVPDWSMSIFLLWYCTLVLWDVVIGGNWIEHRRFPCHFLHLHINLQLSQNRRFNFFIEV